MQDVSPLSNSTTIEIQDFAVFDLLRGHFYKNDGSFYHRAVLFLCGSIAGICALTATDPLEFVRIRLAMEKSFFTYSNSLHAFKVIYQKEGFFGFYKGYLAAIIGVMIYQGISFSLYTKSKERVHAMDPSKYQKWYVDFFLGGMSAVGQIIAYPLDILRKRMQGQALLVEKGELKAKQTYKELIRDIYSKEKGVLGFFKGVTLNLIKAPLASASAWTIKNFINRRLNKFYDF